MGLPAAAASCLPEFNGPLSSPASLCRGVSSIDFGYISGGTPGFVTTVNRIDYSNDTGTTPTKGPMNVGRYSHTGNSNANFGY